MQPIHIQTVGTAVKQSHGDDWFYLNVNAPRMVERSACVEVTNLSTRAIDRLMIEAAMKFHLFELRQSCRYTRKQ
jgi:hypothetical protein